MFLYGLSLVIPLAVLGILVLGAVALAGIRREGDPGGDRPHAVYLFTVVFVALLLVLFEAFTVVNSLARLPLDERSAAVGDFQGIDSGQSGVFDFVNLGYNENDVRIREAVQSGIVALVALLVLVVHVRRARELIEGPTLSESSLRTYLVYLYLVCFVSIVTVLGAGTAALNAIFELIAPGIAGGTRGGALATLVASLALTGGAGAIYQFHWNRASALRARLPGHSFRKTTD